MDDVDTRLIAALRKDARRSLSDLAALLGITRSTVRSRIERMQTAGIIRGYTVVLQDEGQGAPIRGMMMLGIEGRGAERITRQLSGLPEVQAIHSTNGRWDLIIELGTTSLEDLDSVLARIRRFDGIATSETNLLLSTKSLAH